MGKGKKGKKTKKAAKPRDTREEEFEGFEDEVEESDEEEDFDDEIGVNFKKDDMIRTHSLTNQKYNNRRGKISEEMKENGRYPVEIYDIDGNRNFILLKPENMRKLRDQYHYGYWGCSGCGGQCMCGGVGYHDQECHHYMNTLRRKGPDCPGTMHCVWLMCCLSEEKNGACKAIDRQASQIPYYQFPEKEWVKDSDGNDVLAPKKWPYF